MILVTVSVGVRFTTLPDHALNRAPVDETLSSSSTSVVPPATLPSQPPTTITAIFSPITGHIQTSYVARVSQDLALCSRFLFNVNSYESEWSMGAEWWMRRKPAPVPDVSTDSLVQSTASDPALPNKQEDAPDAVQGVVKARISTSYVSVCSAYR